MLHAARDNHQVSLPQEARKPRLFVGCATSDLAVAKAIEQTLWREVEVEVWDEDKFDSTHAPVETLTRLSKECDFAVLIVSPLDPSRHEGFKSARDNVVFEIGLFFGALCRDRVFIVGPHDAKTLKLPTDLSGLEPFPYDSNRSDGNLTSAVGPACTSILRRITALRSAARRPAGAESKVASVPSRKKDGVPVQPDDSKRQRLVDAGIVMGHHARIGIPTVTSTDFFHSERFTKAFPGVRDVEWFYDKQVITDRLARLLKPPLKFYDADSGGGISGWVPIWWWRGLSNNPIESFEVLPDGRVLLDKQELVPSRLAAVNGRGYYQSLVYVECAADQPTGLYKRSQVEVDRTRKEFGYCWEEFGLVHGRLIHRTEFDDGAAVLDEKLVELNDEAELRTRYVTTYNFVIAAHESPINNKQFDLEFEQSMNELLLGKDVFDRLIDRFSKLPRREHFPH